MYTLYPICFFFIVRTHQQTHPTPPPCHALVPHPYQEFKEFGKGRWGVCLSPLERVRLYVCCRKGFFARLLSVAVCGCDVLNLTGLLSIALFHWIRYRFCVCPACACVLPIPCDIPALRRSRTFFRSTARHVGRLWKATT